MHIDRNLFRPEYVWPRCVWGTVAVVLLIAGLTPAADTPQSSKKPPKLLVMWNGRVLAGTIRADDYGYHVESARSSLYFTFEHVKFTASDWHDAYTKMADSIPDRSVRRDLTLGRWCYEYHLLPEAAMHLRKVLKVDGTNQEAKELLAMMEPESNSAAGQSAKSGVSIQGALRERPEIPAPRVSPAAVREYVTTIQPLLLARCGNVHCHGSETPTSFRLEIVRAGHRSNRSATLRNLANVLDRVDPRFVSKSPLLDKGLKAHGDLVASPFEGPSAADQEARLRKWIATVAPDLNRLKRDESAKASITAQVRGNRTTIHKDSNVVPASATSTDLTKTDSAATAPRSGIVPASAQAAPAKSPDSPAKVGPVTDPFDPSEFNAQQHQR